MSLRLVVASVACVVMLFAANPSAHAGEPKPAPAPKKEPPKKEPPKPEQFTHRITGLAYPERADELKELFNEHPKIKLLSVDYDRAEATFEYIAKEVSAETLRSSMGSKMFGVKPELTVPRESLKKIEIAVVGLDCKGCCLGAYNSISKIEGMEQATVSFKEGRLVALIDPAKTNQAALEEALRKARVGLKDDIEKEKEKEKQKELEKAKEKENKPK